MSKKNILAESVKVECANPQPCCCEATFTFAADAVKAEKNKVTAYIGGVARLPGFRAGKAPANLVSVKFAGEIKEELRNRIMGAAFSKIEENKDLEILTVGFKTQPDMEQEGDITFTLNMNTAPEIDLGDYNAITVELPQDAVSDEMIEERLKLYHTMYGSFTDVEEPAKADDMLKVNYSSDFELPEDASAGLKRRVACDDTFLMLSEPESIPGSIAALTGATVTSVAEAAKVKLEEVSGFTKVTVQYKTSDKTKDTVISQSVAEGTELELDAEQVQSLLKGCGYAPAEQDPAKFHGIGKFDPETGKIISGGTSLDGWTLHDADKNIYMFHNYVNTTEDYKADGTNENFFSYFYPSMTKYNTTNFFESNKSKIRYGNTSAMQLIRMPEICLIAAEADLAVNGGANAASVGASGAIFGLMGALLYFGWHYRVYLGNVVKSQILPLILNFLSE